MAAGGRWVIPASGNRCIGALAGLVMRRWWIRGMQITELLWPQHSAGVCCRGRHFGPTAPKSLQSFASESAGGHGPAQHQLTQAFTLWPAHSLPPKKSFFLPASNSTSNSALLAIGRVSSAFPPCKITTEEARTMAPLILHNVPDDELYIGDDGVKRPYAMLFSQLVLPSLLPRPIFHLPPILRHVRS